MFFQRKVNENSREPLLRHYVGYNEAYVWLEHGGRRMFASVDNRKMHSNVFLGQNHISVNDILLYHTVTNIKIISSVQMNRFRLF